MGIGQIDAARRSDNRRIIFLLKRKSGHLTLVELGNDHGFVSPWVDLPASYHNSAASFAFADGHAQLQRWRNASTKQPAQPDGADLPLVMGDEQTSDFRWVVTHMSVKPK